MIDTRGPYSLREAAAFWRSFLPARGTAIDHAEDLAIFFRRDGDFRACAALLRQQGETIEITTDDEATVRAQIARMLSLDVDPAPWRDVLDRDETMAALQARWPGFRPVCFASPWEAALWGVLVQGIGMQRATRLRASLAERHGERVEIGAASSFLFPAPAKVLELDTLEGLDAERARRLRAVAEMAAAGKLEADRLRAMPASDALRELRSIRGIGEWTASHVLLRGAALADGDALTEPRVRRGIAAAYGTSEDAHRCAKITSRWLPYRMWGSILVVRALRSTPGWRNKKP